MNNSNNIIAVEIGSSKIKGAIGQIDPSGALVVTGIEEARQHPNYVRYGCVQNVKEVANELRAVIAKLTNRMPHATIEAVYVGIGGRSLKSTPARLSMPLADVTEVTPEIVGELLGRARNASSDTELLEVEPVQFLVDGKSQGTDPVGTLGRDITAKVNLVSCRSQILRNLQMAITDKLGVRINKYVVRPMAMADLVLTSDEKRLGVMLVDCGAETTTVSIYKDGVLTYLATVPLGSRHITRDLTTLPLLEEKAEEIKRTIGNALPDSEHHGGGIEEIDTSAINNIVGARAAEIVANINAQIGYADLTIADLPRGIVLVGGGSMLQGFAEQLNSVSGLPVRRGSLPPHVRVQGSKISTGEDLDVISLLYRLSREPKLRPCVKITEPRVVAPEPEPEPAAAETDEEWQLEDEKKKKQKSGGFSFGSIWEKMKNGMQTPASIDEKYDDDDEDDFTN